MQKPNIGFIGVGRMGANIARRLADLGYHISAVHDHYPALAETLAHELGCKATSSLSELSSLSDVIFTVVTDDAAMDAIFSESSDLLQSAAGKTFINCATVSPECHQRAYDAASKVGAKTLAASMASSITQARQGTLYLMIGGDEEVYSTNELLLKDISSALRYVGPVANAARIKALVNMVMNINTAGLAEGLGLGAALGLDLHLLMEIFSQTGANSRVLETDGADMITREHDCYFSAAHAAKDSGIANAMAKQAGIKTPLSLATESQYQQLIDLKLGELDKSGIAELTFPGRSITTA